MMMIIIIIIIIIIITLELRAPFSYCLTSCGHVVGTIFYAMLTVHLDILYNENQLDTLFIFILFHQSTSTCFGHVYCPSSGGIHSICTAIGTCYMSMMTGCWLGQGETVPS
jgi:hypothetical protein